MPKSKGRKTKAADKKARAKRTKMLKAKQVERRLEYKKMIEAHKEQMTQQYEEKYGTEEE